MGGRKSEAGVSPALSRNCKFSGLTDQRISQDACLYLL